MKYISSQSYIDYDLVEKKMQQLTEAGTLAVEIPFWVAGEIDGEEYAVQADHHHLMCAARELGLEIIKKVSNHPEDLTGLALLDATYNDHDWYDVDSSDLFTEQFVSIW